ncbi:MAG TPA: hypothetical protein VGY52_09680 [Roseiarcus sp.]|nr:hypothetical protein [Roseiarcus sp.]
MAPNIVATGATLRQRRVGPGPSGGLEAQHGIRCRRGGSLNSGGRADLNKLLIEY